MPGARHVACCEPHASVCHGRAGGQCPALERCGHAGKFVGRVAGTEEVSGGHVDLDPSGEQRSPAQVGVRRQLLGRDVQGMFERVADGCRRQRNVALGQSQQGESRLRIPPRLASREERVLRTFEITQLESHAAQFGEGPPEFPAQVRSQFRTCGKGFLFRLGERPAQPKDLGTVHAAAAMDAADTASVAPPLHGLGPLLGEVVLSRAPGACTPARSRPFRSRWHRAHRRWWPPPPPRRGPGLDGPRPPGSPRAPRPPDRARPPPGCRLDPTAIARPAHSPAARTSPIISRS